MRIIGSIVLLLALPATARSQDVKTQLNQGLTPLAIASGTPSGSYRLNDFESLNVYNGKVNVTIPLLDIGGAGFISIHNDRRGTELFVVGASGYLREQLRRELC